MVEIPAAVRATQKLKTISFGQISDDPEAF